MLDVFAFAHLPLWVIGALMCAAAVAGWVDAVVGGGGLIQLPALLLAGVNPVGASATNKVSGSLGTITSAITYYRRMRPSLKTAIPMAVFAGLGAAGGALLLTFLPKKLLIPLVLVALVAVAIYTAVRKDLGTHHRLRFTGTAHIILVLIIGVVLGFYDGLIGPGTGSFLIFALVALAGYGFVEASAKAKIVNAMTNIAAVLTLAPHGVVHWGLGLAMGVCNLTGSYIGANMAMARGAAFVRVVFLLIVAVLIISLSVQLFASW